MIKGIQKQAVMLPLPQESRFECAYFIARRMPQVPRDPASEAVAELEMLAEASKILNESGLASRPRRDRAARRARLCRMALGALLFFAGTGLGATVALLLG